ncbi:hypothetical protein SMMN14_04671 [Sphaerulina musiva]
MHHLHLLIFTTFQVVLARTDLTGCTSTSVSSPAGASIAWYVPETGEVCDLLDCGGGRAPPKTTVPGCPLYSGTASYSPSYLAAGVGEMGVVFSSFSASFATTAEVEGEAAVEMTTSTTTTSSYSSGVTLYSSPSPPPAPTTTSAPTTPTTSIPSSPLPPPIILGSTNTTTTTNTNTTTTTSIAEHGSRNGTTTTSTTPSITTSGILPLSQQQQQQQTSGATKKVVEIGRRGYWIGGLVGILCVVGGWGLLE